MDQRQLKRGRIRRAASEEEVQEVQDVQIVQKEREDSAWEGRKQIAPE